MVYFVLPVYNEERNLCALISGLRQAMFGQDYKIVAVNDGSVDDSVKILNDMGGSDLLVTGSLINMNIGAVFSDGIGRVLSEAGDDDIMVIMESDQTSEVDFVKVLVTEITEKGNDVAIASRYKKGGGYAHFPTGRWIFSYCANYLMKFYFPVNSVTDYTIFFRAYKVSMLKTMIRYFGEYGLIQSKGFVANAELLIKMSFFTDKIVEVPYVYDYQKKLGTSKINVVRTINEYFVLINYMRRIVSKVQSYKKRNNVEGVLI